MGNRAGVDLDGASKGHEAARDTDQARDTEQDPT
jgi:hypothetical protein